ncbi:Putative multidrug resistance protein MdtD [Achromobacter pulmonis]|uniref:MFS transporter n=1 Tax=Achromobacter pulmonis TaxID=1389932 RepID=UPI001467EB90|nr:MFS transporter [Achromobacter pulmonis]CAB3687358.1 Putative multidrug resistance protein MdtD [Achromobacter pulmonis]
MTQPNPVYALAPAVPGRWLVLAIVSSALLLIVVDMTVLYTALPRLTHDLGVTASSKLWIVNIYALVVSGLLLGMGTLGDRLGHKRLFMMGLAVFGAASLAAAYAPNPAALIAARAVLAVGAAMMMPATLSILRLTFADERERAIAIGVWASVASGGAALGPVIGGILLEHFWWGSVFLINLPIVLVALPLARRYIPASKPEHQRPWDLVGSLQVMAGLILTAYALKELGRAQPSWLDATLACAGGAAMLAIFARRQRARPYPLIDFAIFRNRGFSSAVASALFAAAALLGLELVLSQRLQLVLGMSPLQAALYILPLPLAAFIAGPLAGWLLPKAGSARLLFVSLLVSGLGMGGYLFSYGGALGVTLMGSILSGVYAHTLDAPAGVPAAARDSLDQALLLAERLSGERGASLAQSARDAFDAGYAVVIATAALLLLGTAALVLLNRLRGNGRVAAAR